MSSLNDMRVKKGMKSRLDGSLISIDVLSSFQTSTSIDVVRMRRCYQQDRAMIDMSHQILIPSNQAAVLL